MIAYFDTSAIVPLVIAESGTRTAGDIWDRADRLVSVRLAHVEARAALAQAARLRRLSPQQLRSSVRELGDLFAQVDLIEADEDLIHEAGDLAEAQELRAYDAVHLAGIRRVADDDLVVVAGDRALLTAAEALGIAIAVIG